MRFRGWGRAIPNGLPIEPRAESGPFAGGWLGSALDRFEGGMNRQTATAPTIRMKLLIQRVDVCFTFQKYGLLACETKSSPFSVA